MKLKKSESLAVVKLCCQALEEKKVENLRVMDVSGQSSITDFLILATGTSSPHLRALRIEAEKALDSAKVRIVGMEIPQDGGWMVIDAFDVMIHLFTAEQRERYGLENLWKDAEELSIVKLLASPKRPKAKASVKSKKANEKQPKPSRKSSKKSPG